MSIVSGSALDVLRNTDGNKFIKVITPYLVTSDSLFSNMFFKPSNGLEKHNYYRKVGRFEAISFTWDEGLPINDVHTEEENISNIGAACAVRVLESEQLGVDPKEYLASKSEDAISALKETYTKNIFYGNGVKETVGLTNRSFYNTLNGDDSMVIDGGGTGDDLTSIFIIHTGANSVYSIYPNVRPMGVGMKPLNEVQGSSEMIGGVERKVLKWFLSYGLCIENTFLICRIANISMSDLKKKKVKVFDLLMDAFDKIAVKASITGTRKIFCRPEIISALRREGYTTNVGSHLMEKSAEQFGKFFNKVSVLDTPMIECAEIRANESKVI